MEEIDLNNSPNKSQEELSTTTSFQISNNNDDSISYETKTTDPNLINPTSSVLSETISQTIEQQQSVITTASDVSENSIQAITETMHPSDQISQSVYNPPPSTIMTTNQESTMMMMSSQMNPVLPPYQPSIMPQPMIPNYDSSIVGNPDSSMMMNLPPQQQQQQTNPSFQIPNYGPPLPSSPPIVQPEQQPQYLYSIPQPPSFLSNNNSNVITTKEQPNNDEDVSLPDDLVDVYNHLGIVGKILTGGSIFTIRFLQLFRNISETLVDALGITKPKYEQEYLAYQEMKQEEQQRQDEIQKLYATWQPPPTPSSDMSMMPVQTPTNPNFIQPIMTEATASNFNIQNPNIIPTSMANMDTQSPPNP